MRTSLIPGFMAAAAIVAVASSCAKEQQVNEYEARTPHKVEFVKRDLSGVKVGANLPANAEAVDLGLSVKWANINLGAADEKSAGDYYSWGEIQPSTNTTWENYEFCNYEKSSTVVNGLDGILDITKYCFDFYGENQDLDKGGVNLDINDDAAYVQWGAGWRMPTADEAEELVSECTWSKSGDSKYFTVTGPNGNSIIISNALVARVGTATATNTTSLYGGLWTSTLSSELSIHAVELIPGSFVEKTGATRAFGLNIRPVHE